MGNVRLHGNAAWAIFTPLCGSGPRSDTTRIMGLQSLRDKLLQAGVITDEQAKKAESEKARQRAARRRDGEAGRRSGGERRQGEGGRHRQGGPPRQRAKQAAPLSPEEQRAREEEAAFRERERELAREREENRRRAVEDRKRQEALRALAEKHEVTERGDEAFHFASRKRKILRIYLTPEQLQKLEAGELAIIDKPLPAELSFALVPREAAEEALRIDPRAVRFFNQGPGKSYGFRSEGEEAPQRPAPKGGTLAEMAAELEALRGGGPLAQIAAELEAKERGATIDEIAEELVAATESLQANEAQTSEAAAGTEGESQPTEPESGGGPLAELAAEVEKQQGEDAPSPAEFAPTGTDAPADGSPGSDAEAASDD